MSKSTRSAKALASRKVFLKDNRSACLSALAFLAAVVLLFREYPDNFAGYLVSAPALVIIVLTALARVNDITIGKKGAAWHARRLGLVLTGAAAFTILASPLSTTPRYPTWTGVMLFWGVALAWLTTPGMPPWSKYVFGKEGQRNIY